MRIFYLYKITNLINGKIYIGQKVSAKKRWLHHKQDTKKPKHILQYAMAKHGINNFKFEVLCVCEGQDTANKTEAFLIKILNTLVSNGFGYNVALGGLREPITDSHKKKMSEAKLNKVLYNEKLSDKEEEIQNKWLFGESFHSLSRFYNVDRDYIKRIVGYLPQKIRDERNFNIKDPSFKGKTWKLVDGKRVWRDK